MRLRLEHTKARGPRKCLILPQAQETTRAQTLFEHTENSSPELGVEVNQDIPAENHVHFTKRVVGTKLCWKNTMFLRNDSRTMIRPNPDEQ